MGIVNKGAKCNVDGCDQDGVRSLNTKKVEDAGLRLNSSGKKSVLCKQHYKEWKRRLKTKENLSVQDMTERDYGPQLESWLSIFLTCSRSS